MNHKDIVLLLKGEMPDGSQTFAPVVVTAREQMNQDGAALWVLLRSRVEVACRVIRNNGAASGFEYAGLTAMTPAERRTREAMLRNAAQDEVDACIVDELFEKNGGTGEQKAEFLKALRARRHKTQQEARSPNE